MPNKKKVVLVTGASSGIGNACATHLAKKGYSVYGTSRNPAAKPRRVDEFFELVRMDVSNNDDVEAVISYITAKENVLDAIICCAGIGIAGALEEIPIIEAQRQFDVNFMGVARLAKAGLPLLRASKGHFIVIGSIAGLFGVPFQSYYSASKCALTGLVDSLRMELYSHHVKTSLILPSDFRTGFTSARAIYGLGADSPYGLKGKKAIAIMEQNERYGADPIIVARLMLKLLNKKRLRPRYSLGPLLQRTAVFIARILPKAFTEIILLYYYRQKGDKSL